MELGLVLEYGDSLESALKWCQDNKITTCQLGLQPDELTDETAKNISQLTKRYSVRITALVGHMSGPSEYTVTGGPSTLGIVPPAFRAIRMNELKAHARFAVTLGVPDVCTHMGFIPENPSETLYVDFIASLRHLVRYYESLGINLNMETGQETPTTLLRVIGDIKSKNLGINFDPANFLMYGRANPIDALNMLGPYVYGVHAKDGEYPTCGTALGKEKPLGEGSVNMEMFIKTLFKVGYKGPLTIEREISGEQQQKDILVGMKLLMDIIEASK